MYATNERLNRERDWILDEEKLLAHWRQLSPEKKQQVYKADDSETEAQNPILIAKKYFSDVLLQQEADLRKETAGMDLPWQGIEKMKQETRFPSAKELLDKI